MNADELAVLVRRRIESRYRRIVFVHRELERLNTLAKPKFSAGKKSIPGKAGSAESGTAAGISSGSAPAESFEDFVFGSIDFSVYKKIDAEEFLLLFDEGLDDYDHAFFVKMFSMNRDETRSTIRGSYIKVGPYFVRKKTSPLLLSIMRTVHSSLDFAPLIGAAELPDRNHVKTAAEVFDGLVIRHSDGMETKLFVPKAVAAGNDALLCGTFYPLGKAWTITLIP